MHCSVCLCTYNGAKYIVPQLDSIFSQPAELLGEVIVVDDGSSDLTRSILLDYSRKYSKLSVFFNCHNLGVLKNFEKCIGLSNCPIIVLCDQDDVWDAGKLHSIVVSSIGNLKIPALFIHNASIIDENDCVLEADFMSSRHGFSPSILSNFVSNKYLGCCIAFNRRLVDYILPFPSFAPQHDIWIGIVSVVTGKCFYCDKKLTFYRLHSSNASPAAINQSGSVAQIIQRRASFVLCWFLIVFRVVMIRVRAAI